MCEPDFSGDFYLVELDGLGGAPYIPETSAVSGQRSQLAADIWHGVIELPRRIDRINRARRECVEADAEIAALVGQLSYAAGRSPWPDLCQWLDERRADYHRDGDFYARKRVEEEGRRVDEMIDDRRCRASSYSGFSRRLGRAL